MNSAVFLSAGVPDNPQRGPYVDISDPVAIRDAVRSLTAVTLRNNLNLVFGGHPAISPLVLQAAESIDRLKGVVIYQSRFFVKVVPPESFEIPNFQWTDAGDGREASLRIMREKMLQSHDFVAGVFIGGMDGVETEFEMFREELERRKLRALTVPVPTTGGAALRLFEQVGRDLPSTLVDDLRMSRRYQSLFRRLIP